VPPNRFESEVESFLEGSHGDRTHHKQRADHHTVTPLCGTLLFHRLVTACLRLSGISKTLVYQSKHGVLPPLPPNF